MLPFALEPPELVPPLPELLCGVSALVSVTSSERADGVAAPSPPRPFEVPSSKTGVRDPPWETVLLRDKGFFLWNELAGDVTGVDRGVGGQGNV